MRRRHLHRHTFVGNRVKKIHIGDDKTTSGGDYALSTSQVPNTLRVEELCIHALINSFFCHSILQFRLDRYVVEFFHCFDLFVS